MRRRSLALGLTLFAAALLCVAATVSQARPTHRPPAGSQGGFEVQALVDGFWQPVGDLAFDRNYREAAVALPDAALAGPRVRVRLVQHGGGAAHIDQVSLGTTPPSRVDGSPDPDALSLSLRVDHDVFDASGRTIDVTFSTSRPANPFRLVARVEGKVIGSDPFAFPPANQFRTLTAGSAFYRYAPKAGATAPSWPEALDAASALFSERSTPTSGHPEGLTWGWVANDRETLYAAVEFTPDNTRDGEKDYSSVLVLNGTEVREFRVSEGETRWGRPLFGPTARAGYRHKLYLFRIPFSELGLRSADDAAELKLAFSAYGTATPGWLQPPFQDYGSIGVGTASAATTFTITNTTGVGMVLQTPWYTRVGPGSGAFPLAEGTCHSGLTLAPLATCTFQIAFAPTSVGPASDDVVVGVLLGGAAPAFQGVHVQGNGFSTQIPVLRATGLAVLAFVLAAAGLWVLRRG